MPWDFQLRDCLLLFWQLKLIPSKCLHSYFRLNRPSNSPRLLRHHQVYFLESLQPSHFSSGFYPFLKIPFQADSLFLRKQFSCRLKNYIFEIIFNNSLKYVYLYAINIFSILRANLRLAWVKPLDPSEMNVAGGDKMFSDKHFLSPTSEICHQNHSSRQGRDSCHMIMNLICLPIDLRISFLLSFDRTLPFLGNGFSSVFIFSVRSSVFFSSSGTIFGVTSWTCRDSVFTSIVTFSIFPIFSWFTDFIRVLRMAHFRGH